MKLLTKQQQQTVLNFICEQYAAICSSRRRERMRVNEFSRLQTQAYNAAEAVAGKEGVKSMRERMEDLQKEGGNDIQKEGGNSQLPTNEFVGLR